ncbi:MAG: hypothetical protein CM1200mP20_00640 [Pseudomonadota bacterium]|nr:MAG: hypothetical protein CM1200mP20_00640 [Pseudomonadota bacterium]
MISADLPTLARQRPGNKIQFALCTLDKAAEARRDLNNWFPRFRTQIKQANTSGMIDSFYFRLKTWSAVLWAPMIPANLIGNNTPKAQSPGKVGA